MKPPDYIPKYTHRILDYILNSNKTVDITELFELFPDHSELQVEEMIEQIYYFNPSLLRKIEKNSFDYLASGPQLKHFLENGGFVTVHKNIWEEKKQKEEDDELDRNSKRAAINANEIAERSNKIAKKSNWIAILALFISIIALLLSIF